MRVSGLSPLHLTYCTNIHPGVSWEDHFAELQQHVPAVKARLSPDAPFGIGLRLSDAGSRDLLRGDALPAFQEWLRDAGCYVFTINGFPYGGFHRETVKDRVYAPDWRTPERSAYTRRLARVLAALLPDGVDGSISTVPVSYKPWFDAPGTGAAPGADTVADAFETASLRIAATACDLALLADRTGKTVTLDLEPEPDCLLENTAETVDFFCNWLFPVGGRVVQERMGVSGPTAADLLRRHVRVCYDTCHFAVEYETPDAAFAAFADAGIQVGKIQLSSALKAALPASTAARHRLARRLGDFAESTYLHQVVERRADGSLRRYRDLPAALPHVGDPDATAWRIHYHVPLFLDAFDGLASTQGAVTDTLAVLLRSGTPDAQRHLEVETYTWEVLPDRLQTDVQSSIAREMRWVLGEIDRLAPRSHTQPGTGRAQAPVLSPPAGSS